MSNKDRVLVIGLDGATWDILDPLIEEGYLPNLRKIKESGVSGILKSNFPPITGSAWMSIATGKNPGETGVFDFLVLEDRQEWRIRPLTSADYQKNGTIWDYLSSLGKKVGVVNYPMLYPPYKISGIMASGLGAPEDGDIFYPKDLRKKLRKAIGKHKIYVPFRRPRYNKPENFIKDIKHLIKYNYKLADSLIDESYDLFLFVISAPDFLGHYGWDWFENKSSKYHKVFKDIWNQIDEVIGLMVKKWKDANLMIISDHGIGKLKEIFLVNNWLQQEGFLILKGSGKKLIASKTKKSTEISLKKTFNFFSSIFPGFEKYIPLHFVKKHFVYNRIIDDLDLNASKAFALRHCGLGNIYINSDESEEYEKIKSSIIDGLKSLCGRLGKHLQIYSKEEIYKGNFMRKLPDLTFMIDNNQVEVSPLLSKGPLFVPPMAKNKSGSHRLEGIFIVAGPSVEDKNDFSEISGLTDVVPAICKLLAVDSPKENIEAPGIEIDNEKIENREIARRLKDLGYL